MWQLRMTNAAKEWLEAGSFETMTAAAGRICQLENRACVFLQIYVDPVLGNDDEAFGHLEYIGQRALYVVKRRVN